MAPEKTENQPSLKGKLTMEQPRLTWDDLNSKAGKAEETVKELIELQKQLKKNREAIRRWLSLMG